MKRWFHEKTTRDKTDGEADDTAQLKKKMFMDMVLESIIAEEFGKSLTVKSLIDHPAEVSDQMIDADLRSFQQSDAVDRSHGPVLADQLNMIEAELIEASPAWARPSWQLWPRRF